MAPPFGMFKQMNRWQIQGLQNPGRCTHQPCESRGDYELYVLQTEGSP